jgi:teichuronic acid biosynthesis glycosyltransferase TuaC
MSRTVRTLLFSTLYPSSARPGHGIFVETRLRELLKTGSVQARVVAPVPWFPSSHPRFGDYARLARTPAAEVWNGIEVLHPRYPLIPKLGMSTAPFAMAVASLGSLRRLIRDGFDFDVIDAHYYYPDGVAAALLAKWLGKPLIITARGSDLNLIAQHAWPRRLMRWAAGQATASVGVSAALARRLMELGAPEARVHVLRNGVDTERFSMRPDARQRLGITGTPLILSVGNLLPVKRHALIIEAFGALRQKAPRARLAIVGGGPLRAELAAQIAERGLAEAVDLVGPVPQELLAYWYSAADLLVLASSREGWPNVLLEAFACGTPVLASRVGGVPEVVTSATLGSAVPFNTASELTDALMSALERQPDRKQIRAHALGMGWAQISEGQLALFAAALTGSQVDRPPIARAES